MSIQISFSSISFIRVSQDTVGTIFGTGLHICIMMIWISSMFDFGFFHTKYIQHPVYINTIITICLTFVFKPCGNSAWARPCTPHVGFRPPWKITSCQHLFRCCLIVCGKMFTWTCSLASAWAAVEAQRHKSPRVSMSQQWNKFVEGRIYILAWK